MIHLETIKLLKECYLSMERKYGNGKVISIIQRLFQRGDIYTAQDINKRANTKYAHKYICLLRSKNWKIKDRRTADGIKEYWLEDHTFNR